MCFFHRFSILFPSSPPPHSRDAVAPTRAEPNAASSGAKSEPRNCASRSPFLALSRMGMVFSPDFIGNSSGDHRNFMGISEYFIISDISYDMT